MKELILTAISELPEDVFAQTDLEKLTISNSTLEIPASIGNLQQLKELRFIENTDLSLPVEILNLRKAFILFDRNTPEHIKLAGQIIFDFQRNKIKETQAKVFLKLLQDQELDAAAEKNQVIAALDYRIKEVQLKALAKLSTIFPMLDTISEKATVCILGNTEVFKVADIKPRLKKLNLSLQTAINENTTLVVLAKEPKLKSAIGNVPITTEENFFDWINKADKLLLSEKTEVSANAINNVAAMLKSANPANVTLAFQMMKTNGVSTELLTELLIFINSFNGKDKESEKTAKALFKKHAPKDLIAFLGSKDVKSYNSLRFSVNHEKVYDWIEQHTEMDALYMAQRLCDSVYIKRSGTLEKVEFFKKRIIDDRLDLSDLTLEELPDELKQFNTLKALYLVDKKGSTNIRLRKFPEMVTSFVELEKLDLFGSYIYSLPDSMSNLTSLKYFGLPQFSHFPEVISTLTSLEVLEMDFDQLKALSEPLHSLVNLKKVIITDFDFYLGFFAKGKVLWEQKKALFPEGCGVLFQDEHKRR